MWWALALLACGAPGGESDSDADDDGVVDSVDCAPDDASIAPGKDDPVGDGVDQDCSGADGVDVDGDGFIAEASGGDDCDDADATVHPGAEEVWYDGVDQPCDGEPDDDRDGDGVRARESGGRDCDDDNPFAKLDVNVLQRTLPEDGTVDVLPDTPLQLQVQLPDPHATVTVAEESGAVVDGTTTIEGDLITFTPTFGWPPFGNYTATLTTLCSTFTTTFATSDLGQPADVATLSGTTWKLDLRTGVVTQPPVFGALLTSAARGYQALQLGEVSANAAPLLGTYLTDAATEQDVCVPTFTPVDADLSANPIVTLEPDATWYLGVPAAPGESVLTGMIRPDGSEIIDAAWTITTDVRDAFAALGGGSAGQVCAVLALGGFGCSACPDGEPLCLETRIERLELTPITMPLVPRTEDDIAIDPVCNPPE